MAGWLDGREECKEWKQMREGGWEGMTNIVKKKGMTSIR